MRCGADMCSFYDMVVDPWGHIGAGSGTLGAAAVLFNFLTIAAVVLHYGVIFNRERLMIAMLDEDASAPENRLHEILPLYPAIDAALTRAHTQVWADLPAANALCLQRDVQLSSALLPPRPPCLTPSPRPSRRPLQRLRFCWSSH
jgi:hypothetical protein